MVSLIFLGGTISQRLAGVRTAAILRHDLPLTRAGEGALGAQAGPTVPGKLLPDFASSLVFCCGL